MGKLNIKLWSALLPDCKENSSKCIWVMLKTASRMRQCGIGGWQEQIVTMYGTQIGMVPKGTRAKRSATCSHLFFFFKKRGRWGEGGEERTLCKWINLCCVISHHICWWEQIGVTIPDDGSLSLWCSNSL